MENPSLQQTAVRKMGGGGGGRRGGRGKVNRRSAVALQWNVNDNSYSDVRIQTDTNVSKGKFIWRRAKNREQNENQIKRGVEDNR